jgi:putative addiction module killer protein
MDVVMKLLRIRKFRDNAGKIPFYEWFDNLQNLRAKGRIQIRLDRLSLGLEGDWKTVGDGVRDLRIPEGPGCRVYYAWHDLEIVILLCGGDKATQQRDTETAIRYWRQYRGK